MDLNKLTNFIGIIMFVAVLRYIFKMFAEKTDTVVITEEGLKILDDPKKKEKLRDAVDEYHKTGDWSQTNLNNIF